VQLDQRIVLVDEADLVLVAIERGRKQRLVHARAVGHSRSSKLTTVTLAAGLPRMGRPFTSMSKAGFLTRSNFSMRASVLPSEEMRKSTTVFLAPRESVTGSAS